MSKKTFQSTKIIDGFSACFRQWRADGTHCKFLHGYGIYFKITFEGELDQKNWVQDFGRMKRSPELIDGKNAKEWFDYNFDHTTVVAADDPMLDYFKNLQENGVVQLRIMDAVGCEKFAELVFDKLGDWCLRDTDGRVRVVQVECFEHTKNSAIVKES